RHLGHQAFGTQGVDGCHVLRQVELAPMATQALGKGASVAVGSNRVECKDGPAALQQDRPMDLGLVLESDVAVRAAMHVEQQGKRSVPRRCQQPTVDRLASAHAVGYLELPLRAARRSEEHTSELQSRENI